MSTSFCHRITGISMGCSLYILSIGLFALPGDFTHYIELIKSLNISPALLFPLKFMMCFPLVYHWTNGIRHLVSVKYLKHMSLCIIGYIQYFFNVCFYGEIFVQMNYCMISVKQN